MRLPATLVSIALLAALPAEARAGTRRAARATVELDGEPVLVRFVDGDTFKVLSGRHRGRSARLAGVNALEAYGPVHRFGDADGAPRLLLAVAKESPAVAAAAARRCELAGKGDRYGRLVVACPEAAEALVRAGHAMVFAVEGEPDAGLLALQRDAQRVRAGMWAAGAPPRVPTSVHSADEPDLGRGGAYDRLADTRTGRTEVVRHERRYATCEEVCVGAGPERACMTYVPYARRYRDRPACLR